MRIVLIVSLFICCFIQPVSSQVTETDPAQYARDTQRVNALLDESKKYAIDSASLAISLAAQARELSEKSGFSRGVAYSYKQLGVIQYFQGHYVEAIDRCNQSLAAFKSINDPVGMSNIYNNIGAIFFDQGDDVKALEYYLLSQKYAEQSGDSIRLLTALNNIGAVYNLKRVTQDKALRYYLQALPICKNLGKQEELGTVSMNIGYIYLEKKEYDRAMEYFRNALDAYGESEGKLNVYNYIGELYLGQDKHTLAIENHTRALNEAGRLNLKMVVVKSLFGLGNVHVDMDDFKMALTYFKQAEKEAMDMHAIHELKDIYEKMSMSYARSGDYGNAFKYQSLFTNVKDTLYNIEQDKKLGGLQFEFDIQKKQAQVDLLTKDKVVQGLQLKRQKAAKNLLLGGLAVAFIFASVLYRNYRHKIKINKILDSQKAQIEGLLLNILPAEVARELQETGHATPQYYENASVLFTDFKSFSKLADELSPQQVVTELNECFYAFDQIVEKYNIEKIKTIGDAYMCAGGIPTPDPQHAFNIVKASLDMQRFIKQRNEKRVANGLPPWDIRIGIHSGPLVAGVVGKSKYAYDIWGSTVNIASRMESNGEPGKVNISSSTYEIIKDTYECSYRGKISAKNIGEVDMFFLGEERKS